jgi:hypothetical protein
MKWNTMHAEYRVSHEMSFRVIIMKMVAFYQIIIKNEKRFAGDEIFTPQINIFAGK